MQCIRNAKRTIFSSHLFAHHQDPPTQDSCLSSRRLPVVTYASCLRQHWKSAEVRTPVENLFPEPNEIQRSSTRVSEGRSYQFSNLEELEGLAQSCIPATAMDYYRSGADDEVTLGENKAAWRNLKLVPRMLIDVSNISISYTVLGQKLAHPIFIAPMAMQCLAHPEGEAAVARAAAKKNTPMVVSTMATQSVAEIGAVRPSPLLFFQIYVLRDRQFTANLIRKAERAGYKALVVTVDAPYMGNREANEKNKFHLPDGLRLKNLEGLGNTPSLQQQSNSFIGRIFEQQIDPTLTWEVVPWLKSITKMPIWVKGLVSPEDAVLAVQSGVDGIMCSNHGGRQLDTCVPSAVALLLLTKAVQGRVPVLVDGGIRRGTDILKAMALGASGVLLGRPVLYALGLGGQAGVELLLDTIIKELRLAMALSGCASIDKINPSLILGNHYQSKL